MSEPFIVGMTDHAKAEIEKIQRQQGRFRYFDVQTDIDFDSATGVSLKVGSFRQAVQLRGRMRTYKGLAKARQKLTAQIRSAEFQRTSRHKRNKARHFGRGKVYHAFR